MEDPRSTQPTSAASHPHRATRSHCSGLWTSIGKIVPLASSGGHFGIDGLWRDQSEQRHRLLRGDRSKSRLDHPPHRDARREIRASCPSELARLLLQSSHRGERVPRCLQDSTGSSLRARGAQPSGPRGTPLPPGATLFRPLDERGFPRALPHCPQHGGRSGAEGRASRGPPLVGRQRWGTGAPGPVPADRRLGEEQTAFAGRKLNRPISHRHRTRFLRVRVGKIRAAARPLQRGFRISMKSETLDKVISENHTIKVLAERNGLLLSLTTKTYSYLVFLSKPFVGVRKIVTKDRIVAKAGYDIQRTLELIDKIYGRGGL